MALSMQQKECSFLSSNNVDANASGGQSVPAAHVSADLISKMDLRGCGEAIGVAFTATRSWLPPECPNSMSKQPFWIPSNVEDLTYLWMIHTRRVPVSV